MTDIQHATSDIQRRGARGFTLIETLIVIFVFALMLVGLTELVIRYDTVTGAAQASFDVAHTAGVIAQDVHDDVLQASQIEASHSFAGNVLSSATSSLVLALPSVDGTGNVISGSLDYVGYYASGTDAYRLADIAPGSARPSGSHFLSDAVQSLTFTYNAIPVTSATSVAVDVMTEAVVRGATSTAHVQDDAFLRN